MKEDLMNQQVFISCLIFLCFAYPIFAMKYPLTPTLLRTTQEHLSAECASTYYQPLKLAFLVSKKEKLLHAILEKINNGSIQHVTPSIVISNVKDSPALAVAQQYQVPGIYLDDKDCRGYSWKYDDQIDQYLQKNSITAQNGLICLVDFERIFTLDFMNQYLNRIINMHPSLLPSFPDYDAIPKALDYGVKITGCTVYFVNGIYRKSIIQQSHIEIAKDDTEETVTKKILTAECTLYPFIIGLFAEGKISLNRNVQIND